MGAWIETYLLSFDYGEFDVAPYVGAWIETFQGQQLFRLGESHPTWVRGLKHVVQTRVIRLMSRTLRGCVD